MKIAFAIEHYNPRQGGAERYAWGLSRWLTARGHSVDVFTGSPADEPPEGVTLHPLNPSGTHGRYRQERFAMSLIRALEGKTYDVVHGFNHVWPCDVLRLGGGVHLAFERWNQLSIRHPIGRGIRRLADRFLKKSRCLRDNEVHQFDDPRRRFLAVSRRVAGDMKAYYPACAERIHLVHNGVNLAEYSPERARAHRATLRAEWGVDESTMVLLFLSNNYRLKGLTDLLAALAGARRRAGVPFLLLVAGRDRFRLSEQIARRYGVLGSVLFRGGVEDPLSCYGAADALVHPTYYDACANVCLEAMACGLPVLTSRNNGASELMRDGEGCVLIDMPCPRERLEEAVARLVNPVFRRTAPGLIRRQAEACPIEQNYEKVLAIYEAVRKDRHRLAGAPP